MENVWFPLKGLKLGEELKLAKHNFPGPKEINGPWYFLSDQFHMERVHLSASVFSNRIHFDLTASNATFLLLNAVIVLKMMSFKEFKHQGFIHDKTDPFFLNMFIIPES